MIHIDRLPDYHEILYGTDIRDGQVRFEQEACELKVFLTAKEGEPRFIKLRWNIKTRERVQVLGDRWLRCGNLSFTGMIADLAMSSFFLAKYSDGYLACGVKVRGASLVAWEYDCDGITAWIDVRCGGMGVRLGDRELLATTILTQNYGTDMDSFDAMCDFAGKMCTDPILPPSPVYGGNDWYCAYGNSSRDLILSCARYQALLAEGLENRPFMVIDDGWQINPTEGPWYPNDKFKDMKEVADRIKDMGIRPGIWIRLLSGKFDIDPAWRIGRPGATSLDPSHPEVLQYVAETVRRLTDWGFELIKHDYSEFDIFGVYPFTANCSVGSDGWSFYDRSKTTAEIIVEFYRTILAATDNKALIMGCNTISQLSAGLVHIERVGCDTSGKSFAVTRKNGVNTLAFTMPLNNRFFKTDADCIGVIPGMIDWKYNREWAKILSFSDTPSFISCAEGDLSPEAVKDMQENFARASIEQPLLRPLDWEYNSIPTEYLAGDRRLSMSFYEPEGTEHRAKCPLI